MISNISWAQSFDFNCSQSTFNEEVSSFLSDNSNVYRLNGKNGWYEITDDNVIFYQCGDDGLQSSPIVDEIGGNVISESTLIVDGSFVNISIETDGRREFILSVGTDRLDVSFRRYNLAGERVEDRNDLGGEYTLVTEPSCEDLNVGFSDVSASGDVQLAHTEDIIVNIVSSTIDISLAETIEVPENHYVQYNFSLADLDGNNLELDPVVAKATSSDASNDYLANGGHVSRFGHPTDVVLTITYEFKEQVQIVIVTGEVEGKAWKVKKSYNEVEEQYDYVIEVEGERNTSFYTTTRLGGSNSTSYTLVAIGYRINHGDGTYTDINYVGPGEEGQEFSATINVSNNTLADIAAPNCDNTNSQPISDATWQKLVEASIACN